MWNTQMEQRWGHGVSDPELDSEKRMQGLWVASAQTIVDTFKV